MKNEGFFLNKFHTVVFDFDGVFTDNFVYVDDEGKESVRCSRSDGYAMDLLRRSREKGIHSAEVFVLSTESNPVVTLRCEKMGIGCKQGVKNKLAFLATYLEMRSDPRDRTLEGVVYFGNDLNDLEVMKSVGFSVAPIDAHPLVLGIASKVIRARGGNHFVRLGVEYLLNFDNWSNGDKHEFILDSRDWN